MFSVPDTKQETSATISAANHLLTERIEKAVKIKRGLGERKKTRQTQSLMFQKLKVPQLVVSCSGCPRKFWARVQLLRKDNFGFTRNIIC